MEGSRIVTKEGLIGEAAKLGMDGGFQIADEEGQPLWSEGLFAQPTQPAVSD